MFNSEVIYYIKNSLLLMTPFLLKSLKDEFEKFTIIIKSKYHHVRVALVLANVENNDNHDLMKLDVDLIFDTLMEVSDESSN